MLPTHGLGDRGGESLCVIPGRPRLDRDDDVESLPARRLDETLQADIREPLSHLGRSLDNRMPRHALAGIEIENQSVGAIEVVAFGSPWVDLDDPGLDEADQA